MHHVKPRDLGTQQFQKSSNYPAAGGRRNSGREKGYGSGLPATTAVGSGNGLNHSGSCCDAEETVADQEEEEPGTDKDTSFHDRAVGGGGNLRVQSGRPGTGLSATAGGSPRVRNKRWEAEGAGNEEGTHGSEHDKGMEKAADRPDSAAVEDTHRDCGMDNVMVSHNYPFVNSNSSATPHSQNSGDSQNRQDVQEPKPLP